MERNIATAKKTTEKLFQKRLERVGGMPGWFKNEAPNWFHKAGRKLYVIETSSDFIRIAHGHIASLEITPPLIHGEKIILGKYMIVYHIDHDPGDTKGLVFFSKKELRVAFGITRPPADMSAPYFLFLEKYGGEAAIPGLFIKWKNYLNIPMPGTGQHGDPNISIKITPVIRKAVKTFLEI